MNTEEPNRIPCPYCSEPILPDAKVCRFCHSALTAGAPTPLSGGRPNTEVSNKKLAAGLCGIFLGQLGIHKFLLGYTSEGVTMLLISLLTCGLGGVVMGIIGIVEGITYLTRSEVEFEETYLIGHKGWF